MVEGLPEEVEEGGETEDAAGAAEDGLGGDLGLGEVGGGFRGIGGNQGVFLGDEVEFVLVEEGVA